MLYHLWIISDCALRTQSRPLGDTLTTRSLAQYRHLSKGGDPGPARPQSDLAQN